MFSRVGSSGGRLSLSGSVRVVRFLSTSQKTSGLLLQVCFGFSTQIEVSVPERCVAPFQPASVLPSPRQICGIACCGYFGRGASNAASLPVNKASHARSRNPTNGSRSTPAETQSYGGPVPPLFRQHSRLPELAPGRTNEAVVGGTLQCGWFEDPVAQACERRQSRQTPAVQDWHRVEIRPIGTTVAAAAVTGARWKRRPHEVE
jgi:hypothetical protein